MGSNRVLITVVQQVDVFRGVQWTLLLQRMEWCFKWLSTRSFTDSDTASNRLRSSCTMLDFFKHQLNADSRVHTHIGLHTYTNTHTLHYYFTCWYSVQGIIYYNHIILSFNVYVDTSILIECCVWMLYFGCNINYVQFVCMYVFDSMSWISVPCHEGPPATRGHFRSEPEVAARGRYYCTQLSQHSRVVVQKWLLHQT